MNGLELAPQPDLRLWERFQSGLLSHEQIARSRVLRRWQRSVDHGLSGLADTPPTVALDRLGIALETFSSVLAPGAPFDVFADEMARAGYCGILCDAEGMVMSRRIAEPFQTSAGRAHLIEGSVWSEATRGTNGIGTALFEQAPVSIIGVEHFEFRNHGLACYAAPIRDVRERVVAVLDASGPASVAQPLLFASVVATAAAIEALLVTRTYDLAVPGGLFELERLLERLPHACLLVESTGRVRRTNGLLRGIVPDPREAAFLEQLRSWLAGDSREAGRARDLAPALRRLSVEVEPLGDADDPFASLVHLHPPVRARFLRRPPEPPPAAFAPIAGSDAALVEARARAERFAPTELPILLQAETGTGKELFARAIHAASTRSAGPFVAVNCGAITSTLIESELFGYGPGAFTGAVAGGRSGKLSAAHRGTLFLDEIGEMPQAAQTTLLRFLEDGTFYRVGEACERRADVRLVTTTSRDLTKLVVEGRFRSDLYFRIRGVLLRLPPLRDRSDRSELARVLLERLARGRGNPKPLAFSRAALQWIETHDWPGNVRELKTAIEYALVLAADSPRIERWHLPIEEGSDPPARRDLRHASERNAVIQALEGAEGNLSRAARRLGVARSTLYRLMARHGLRHAADES